MLRSNALALAALLALALSSAGGARAAVDVASFAKLDEFEDVKISPTGEYLAATVKLEDRTAMVVLRRSDKTRTAAFNMGKDSHIADFTWVSPERVLISMSAALGQLDLPLPTGELYGIDADGGRAVNLAGFRVRVGAEHTLIKMRQAEEIFATLVDDLPGDDRRVVVAISPWGDDPFTTAEYMDVLSGNRQVIARAPVRRASFTTDARGVVRFARGAGSDNVSKLYYRADDKSEWQLVNDQAVTARVEIALGFSPDGTLAYLQSEQPGGPDAVVSWNVATGERKPVFRDDDVDPWLVLRQLGDGRAPVGLMLMDGKPRTVFFDDASPEARLYRSLEAAFGDQAVLVTSSTRDGGQAMVLGFSDISAGEFFVFDRQKLKAEFMVARRAGLDPQAMARSQPVTIPARDGLVLHGYLTRPLGAANGPLPMVVLPHGGPIGVFDDWRYDSEVQMFAAAGYAVLQVNFRGSGNRGRDFLQAGARQWGGKMQDDVMDATAWAVAQGHAVADKLCIYGASYGAYAAMMAVAREPELFRCAVGYIGVYDLERLLRDGRRSGAASLVTYQREWIGEPDTLAPVSPVNLAGKIKVPVLLAAGGEDRVTPVEHTRTMESALKRAGVDVQALYYRSEGHGFYTEANRVEYYTRVLDFLSTHLGGAKAQ